ncbi:MAG: acyloxyacyl hydrolase [Planctomycetota bacterium]
MWYRTVLAVVVLMFGSFAHADVLATSGHDRAPLVHHDFSPSAHRAPLQVNHPDPVAPLVALAAMQDDEPLPSGVPAFGTKGSWRWQLHGMGGFSVNSRGSGNNEYGLGGALSYFMEDALSLELELTAWYFDQEGEDAEGINFSILVRWQAYQRDTWTFFVEGGAGLLHSTSDVPDGPGSSFNFTPTAGFGFSFDIGNDRRLLTGLRWHHISNANLYTSNPGRDSIVFWAGISLPF